MVPLRGAGGFVIFAVMNTSWHWQLEHAYRSLDALQKRFPGMEITESMRKAEKQFPMAVTPVYADLIETPTFADPIFAQCVPSAGECIAPPWLSFDPLGEKAFSPFPRLIRRYPDRAVLLASSACAVYCRHCTRKRVSATPDCFLSDKELQMACDFLRAHPSIEDLLISGGDPLLMEDDALATILDALRAVPSLRILRICSRTPATLPQRLTPELIGILAPRRIPGRIRPVGPVTALHTHFNHVRELSDIALDALARVVDAGIAVNNQTVLLHGVNDTPDAIEALCRTLYHNRIRPYYLFQCDLVRGIEHLRTPLATGLDIMRELRVRLSGPAIPNFCLDLPGHGGKIELSPQSIVAVENHATLLKNGAGETFLYPDPDSPDSEL